MLEPLFEKARQPVQMYRDIVTEVWGIEIF